MAKYMVVMQQAAEAQELRELLSAFIDAQVLREHVVAEAQWERACLLCGRWCSPFVDHKLKKIKWMNGSK